MVDAVVSRCARRQAEFWAEDLREGRPEGGEVVLHIVDLEGKVGWGGCNEGGRGVIMEDSGTDHLNGFLHGYIGEETLNIEGGDGAC